MDQYRLVILKDTENIEKKFIEKLDLNEIRDTLGSDKVVGVYISREIKP